MMKKRLLLFLLFIPGMLFPQTLMETVNLPSGTIWNSAYGLVYANGKYWVTSSSSSSPKKIYGLDASGNLTDEITVNYALRPSQGLTHDGTNFWYVENASGYDIFKVSQAGEVLDSIIFSTINGGTSWYVGGAGWDGSLLWVSVYYPNAQAGIYKINTATKQLVDTIFLPAGQLQPQGITVKGDTLFCVNDGFEGTDQIYAFNKTTGDPIYNFNPPEKPGVRQNPRGLAWDGQFFWLMAEPVGASSGRQLFKYDLAGPGTPGITILSPSLNFGNVQIDSSLTLNDAVNNWGNVDLIIDSVVIVNSVFQCVNSFPMSIAPGGTKDLQFKFTPLANLTYTETIKIYHNFKAFPYSSINLSGQGVYTSSYINFNLSELNYGDKRINSTSYIEVIVSNLGSELLSVDSVKVNTDKFFIEGFTPAVIDTVAEVSFKVWFSPRLVQNYSDI
ncbi:MAG: choice-of-anchor D domain-containing protein, partial [Ignavibacteriales bacterium]